MKNICNFIKKYYPFLILFILILIFNLCINIKDRDFIWFLNKANTTNLFDYLINRYNTWTSRVIIEAVLVGILKLNYTVIFKMINIIVMFLIPCVLLKLFSKDKSIKDQFLVICLYLCYNFAHMSSAGWYATLINYMWPLLCLLIGLIPIKNYLIKKESKWYLNIIYLLSILFACNQEQTCAILFGVYLLFFIYTILNKKMSKFSIASLGISISSLIFILTCPGNAVRNIEETAIQYPEYAGFGFVQKVGLGFSTIMTEYLIDKNYLLFILCIILAIFIFKKYKNLFIRLLSLVPGFVILIINYIGTFIGRFGIGRIRGIFSEDGIRKYIFETPKILFLTGISIIFLLLIIFLIIAVLKDKEKFSIKAYMEKYYILLIFLIGLASRLIIGFSSTIFASGFRTNIFFDFSIIISIILLMNNQYLLKEKKYLIVLLSIISILNIFSVYITL